MDPRLQAAFNARNLVFVVGTGVSAFATGGVEVASWRGLIETGLKLSQELGEDDDWVELKARGGSHQA